MSWVRLDDRFDEHPKVADLTDAEFRTWLRVLCYCSRVKDPTVDRATRNSVAGLTAARVKRYADLGLLDVSDGVHVVHDWLVYAPKDQTNAIRQAKWRARRKGVTTPVTETVTPPVTQPSREPDPDPVLPITLSPPTVEGDAVNGRDDELWKLLTRIGGNDLDYQTALGDPKRAKAIANAATAPDIAKPIAWYRKVWATGKYPVGAEQVDAREPLPLYDVIAAWITNVGVHDTEDGVRSEIADRERRRGSKLTIEQTDKLVDLWRSLQDRAA